eukprot:gene27377-4680_t
MNMEWATWDSHDMSGRSGQTNMDVGDVDSMNMDEMRSGVGSSASKAAVKKCKMRRRQVGRVARGGGAPGGALVPMSP